jgi:hypothetical protein
LAGVLLAVVEETDKSDTLDEAGMKKLIGSDIITAWPLFKDFITFTAIVPVRSKCYRPLGVHTRVGTLGWLSIICLLPDGLRLHMRPLYNPLSE